MTASLATRRFKLFFLSTEIRKLQLPRPAFKELRQVFITQAELAEKIHSSQPRIANAENGEPSVSIELIIRAMLATGSSPQDIGQVIASVG